VKRDQGKGTVQFHNGKWRLRLPRSLDPARKWLPVSFDREEKDLAHEFMESCLIQAKQRRESQLFDGGLSLSSAWPRYVGRVSSTAEKRHSIRSATKVRSQLEGMGENWLAKAPFWTHDMLLLKGNDISAWLEDLQLHGLNAKGEPVSDAWVSQCATAIRGVFSMMKLDCPRFTVDVEHQKVQTALTVQQMRMFLARAETARDRIMAGCQMGAGLRKGELLSLPIANVHLSQNPHLNIENGGPNGARTKSGKPRRVELFEPWLGFFKLAVKYFHTPNEKGLLFAGPQSGYMGDWADRFVAWSSRFGQHVTSHDMRHTYAYSMLSGLWGYAPQHITFVSQQLGHNDIRTTQKSYGHWDPGTGLIIARDLRGETQEKRQIVTADWLLGESDSCSPLSSPLHQENPDNSDNWVNDGGSPDSRKSAGIFGESGLQVVRGTARDLASALIAGGDGLPEARHFLKSLGHDDPRVLRALVLVLEGDRRGVRQAADLMHEIFVQSNVSERVATG
jgi:site-specific recombinase XerD